MLFKDFRKVMLISVETLKKKFYPDDSKNGTVIFYSWLRQYIKSNFVVLNIGAGATSDEKIRSLKGEVKQVIGVDIDKEILKNTDLDQVFLIEQDKFPFVDNYFDLAWADFVLEHVENPVNFLKEVKRVLKPGASFFFRTPNKYHYVALIASLTPHWFHELVANRVRGLPPEAHEPYPAFYRFNTRKEILKVASMVDFQNVKLRLIEADPSYMVFNPVAFLLGVSYERLVNASSLFCKFRANIFGRLKK